MGPLALGSSEECGGDGLGGAGPTLKQTVGHHFSPPACPVCYDTSFALAFGHGLSHSLGHITETQNT